MARQYRVAMGVRGRLVVPAELRRQLSIAEGDTVILSFTAPGIAAIETEAAVKDRMRAAVPTGWQEQEVE